MPKKQIRLNAFDMNCVAHQSPGCGPIRATARCEYNRLPYWLDLARTLERGRFDGLFLADVLGVYDVYRRQPGRGAAQRRADAGQRSAAADPGDGGGDRASRLRRHLQPLLRAALSVRAADVDARPSRPRAASAGTSSPAISTARRAAPARTSRPRMTTATRSPTNTWRWSTSSGKAAGRTTPCCATARAASSPIPPKVHRVAARGRQLPASTRSTSASPRRSARRCCTRPAPRRAGGSSPPSMPNACSCRARRPRSSRRAWRRSANRGARAAATRPRS